MEPWSPAAVAFVHVEAWLLRTTHCLLSLKKSHKSLSKFPDIPFWVNLKIMLKIFENHAKLCQMLSRCQEKQWKGNNVKDDNEMNQNNVPKNTKNEAIQSINFDTKGSQILIVKGLYYKLLQLKKAGKSQW